MCFRQLVWSFGNLFSNLLAAVKNTIFQRPCREMNCKRVWCFSLCFRKQRFFIFFFCFSFQNIGCWHWATSEQERNEWVADKRVTWLRGFSTKAYQIPSGGWASWHWEKLDQNCSLVFFSNLLLRRFNSSYSKSFYHWLQMLFFFFLSSIYHE